MAIYHMDLLRHPTSKATWTISQRKERLASKIHLEAQLSPEAILAQSIKDQ
jgi:hypothetical protein